MNRTRPPGFALLLTLIVLALAAVALASASRQHLRAVLDTNLAESRLQTEWAITSASYTLLPQSDAVLTYANEVSETPTHTFDSRISLHNIDLTFRFDDEQAKANLNAVLPWTTPARLADDIQAICDNRTNVQLRSRPTQNTPADESTPTLNAWAQVFPDQTTKPARLLETTASITLVGTGQLRLERAPEEAIRLFCKPWLGFADTQRLIRDRQLAPVNLNHPHSAPDDDAANHAPAFTQQSSAFGLWIVAENSLRLTYQHSYLIVKDDETTQQTTRW